MSTLHTESFFAFPRNTNPNENSNTETDAIRAAHAANLRRAGYLVFTSPNASTEPSYQSKNGFVVRPDPVSPDRNALFFSAGQSIFAGQMGAAIRKRLPTVAGEAIIGGFSLFVPGDYVKSSVATTNPVLRVLASAADDTDFWANQTGSPLREVFRIRQDLRIGWYTDAAMSERAVQVGRFAYLEYRISPTDVRVWLDDVLVLQKTTALNVQTIGFCLEQWAGEGGSSYPAGVAYRWAIGNWYNLAEDAYAPNVRLGPTTRVIGTRPDTDVDVDFQRPTGYASNAAVVAQDLVDTPAGSLQSVSVGDMDIYSSSTDSATAGGKMVHSVAVKVMASNLEAEPHTMRALVRSAAGTEAADPLPREWRVTGTMSARHILCVARRPTDGKIFAAGATACLYVNSNNGAPGTPWVQLQEGGATNDITCIAFRADGWGFFGRSDGRMQAIPPTQDLPLPSFTTNGMTVCRCIIALPNGRIIVGGDAARIAVGPSTAEGNPGDQTKWVGRLLGDDNGPFRQFAWAPTLNGGNGRLFAITARTQGYPNCLRSDDQGTTWAGVYNGANIDHHTAVWDSNSGYFLVTSTMAPGQFFRSPEGATWTPAGGGATSSTSGMVGGYALEALYDSVRKQSVFVGEGGSIMISANAKEVRMISRVTTKPLNGIMQLPNDDYLVVGNDGLILHYTAAVPDGALTPLGGYQPYVRNTAVNPSTGAAWTPAEAAASQFGMRLTS